MKTVILIVALVLTVIAVEATLREVALLLAPFAGDIEAAARKFWAAHHHVTKVTG
jgi:hypothetical protein